ncbi:MAG TPA: amino acid adenylation domain-containing protein, partial [Thermoanaerobaculia bacterium]|nr:amino acid adenylation domain-containing protein [Thermoanaerobaculia bacterium]
LSVQQIFQNPTIHQLARVVGRDPAGLLVTRPFDLISEEDRRQIPAGIEDAYPLSQLQAGMVFHSESDPGSAIYHDVFTYRIEAPFDVQALQGAVDELVSRHPVLRTSFDLSSYGEPLQLVHQQVMAPVEVLDLASLDLAEQDAALDTWREAESGRSFEGWPAPLIRFVAHLRSEGGFHLTFSFHHSILDGWSLASMLTELVRLYASRLGFEAGTLEPPPAMSYRDFVALERMALESEEARRYWMGRLEGSERTVLPRWPGAEGGLQRVRHHGMSLPTEMVSGLKQLARAVGVPLKSVLLAAHAWVVSVLTGQADIVTGVTSTGRPEEADGERVMGLFLNSVPLRVELDGGSWADLVRQVFEAERELIRFRRFPMAELQRALGGQPLFDVSFNYVQFHVYRKLGDVGGLRVTGLEAFEQTSFALMVNFNLTLSSSVLYLTLTYDPGALVDEQVQRIGAYYKTALASMARHPEVRHETFSPLSEPERLELLSWNATQRSYELGSCLHELVEAQAERSPQAGAVVFEGAELSYRELEETSNRLARRLRRLGVGPDSRVGVCMERSAELIVALLGTLKAGAAYLPLDPEYPRERLAFMVEDGRPRVLLTQPHLLSALPEHGAEVMVLDSSLEALAGEDGERFDSGAVPESAAYVIFTSGSTGRPKGVVVPHRGIVNRLLWMQEVYGLSAEDRVLQKTPFSFDVSVWELFWPLMVGARLVMARPGGHRDGAYLAQTIEQTQITTLHFVPSMLGAFLEEPELERCHGLRRVICSGEALPVGLERRFFERLSGVELHNLYGPTEASVDVTYWACEPDGQRATVPIGRPIANTQVHVVDPRLAPVPVGVAGELCLGGVGLARGYLGRPELTAERFIPDPFGEPGGRLYRTGDLARWLPEGVVEFLGRLDHQVKVRGFRIELGEIESVLSLHPAIREAVVLAREEAGDKRLVAYLTAEGVAVKAEELRAYLSERLPAYMVPSAFVLLEEMPLTPNGKADRKALFRIQPDRPETERAFVAPRTHTEEILAVIWGQVLGTDPIGIHDDFFSLGGDSILSIRVAALAKLHALDLSVQQIFQNPTIHQLARVVGRDPAGLLVTQSFDLISKEDRRQLPAGIEDAYPLSQLQAGMIFHSESDPGSAVYHDVFTFHFEAPFSAEALQAAVSQVVTRHPVLRTSFDLSRYDEPLQLVHRQISAPLEIHDLRSLATRERETALAEWRQSEARRNFEGWRAPLVRFVVHRWSEESFHLAFSFHHAILDGWSLASLLTELLQLYLAQLGGTAGALEPPPLMAYKDFVALEREAIGSDEARRYWTEEVGDGAQASLPRWPSQERRTGGREMRRWRRPISGDVVASLHRFSRSVGVPAKSALLAVHARVLGLVTGERDILTGLVSSGRPERLDSERVLGLFLNTLPFRIRLDRSSWKDLARQVFEHEREMLPFRHFPMAELHRALGGQPLFEACFNYFQFHVYRKLSGVENLRLLGVSVSEETSFPLMVNCELTSTSSQVSFEFVYDPAELPDEQVQKLAEYYGRALDRMVHEPQAPYETASLLSEEERCELLTDWNRTASEYPDLCLHKWIEAQARATPERVAVTDGGEELTYRELDVRANQLAYRLRFLGVRPETRVGVCLDRSSDLVVALLAVLKSGGAYVPLDPEYPRERLALVLEDAGATVLVTQRALVERLPATRGSLLCLDEDRSAWPAQSPKRIASEVLPDHPAYLIYTSGSTGRPKGVQITHRALVNFLASMREAPGLQPSDVLLAVTSVSFDISGLELFLPLVTGARVVIASRQTASDGKALAEAVRTVGATLMQATPATWRLMLAEGWRGGGALKALCGGEALPRDLAEELLATGVSLWNMYGPTETTIWSAVDKVEAGIAAVPIGRPIGNTRIYVLDTASAPVPVGVPGELWIGGTGLARGYLNHPDLTAERFVPDPFGAPGGRLYRTGDLARWLPDGRLECLGRLDHQFKVRGFRIEPEEIESVLARHSAVQEALVLAREDAPGNKRLVAYVVPHASEAPEPADLRSWLRRELPEYMVPAAFLVIEALPRTPNGKVDRRALPDPGDRADSAAYRAPRTPVEGILAEIWSDVLGIERVGVDDRFFDLGGHSLLASRVVSRVRETLELELPVRVLFEAATISELAKRVEAQRLSAAGLRLPPLVRHERAEPPPLSFGQQRLWFLDRLNPGEATYNIPFTLLLQGPLCLPALRAAVAEIVRRHESLRTSFGEIEHGPVQMIRLPLALPVPVVDLRALERDSRRREARSLTRFEARRPFDLVHGPLVRFCVLCIDEREHEFLVTLHHTVSDGGSVEVFLRELYELYAAFTEGRPHLLAELPVQYVDFTLWQRSWLAGDLLQEQLAYWKDRLSEVPILALPTDRARPAAQTFQGASYNLTLPRALSDALRELSRREGVSLFMSLLAGLQALLWRLSGQADVTIGLPISGRNWPEIERLIGLFVNTLVLR